MNDIPTRPDQCQSWHPLGAQCRESVEAHGIVHEGAKAFIVGTDRWPTIIQWSDPHTHPLDRAEVS